LFPEAILSADATQARRAIVELAAVAAAGRRRRTAAAAAASLICSVD